MLAVWAVLPTLAAAWGQPGRGVLGGHDQSRRQRRPLAIVASSCSMKEKSQLLVTQLALLLEQRTAQHAFRR